MSFTSGARADICTFGCVLYELLTGQRAFDGRKTILSGAIKGQSQIW